MTAEPYNVDAPIQGRFAEVPDPADVPSAAPAEAPADVPVTTRTTHTTRPEPTFEGLFRCEYPSLLRLAHLLGAGDPEDVVAEAFVRLHDRWQRLVDPSAAGGYLRTIVVNLCRSDTRRRATARRLSHPDPTGGLAPSAESTALAAVSDRALLASLGGLARRQREALVLRFWADLSEKQMAEAMGCSIGSVKSHVSRGLKALRAALNLQGFSS